MTLFKSTTALGAAAVTLAMGSAGFAQDATSICKDGWSITDVDGNGIVTDIEINAYAERSMAEMDSDKSGSANREEFVNCHNVLSGNKTASAQRSEEDAAMLDTNEDGKIDTDEFMTGANANREAAMAGDNDAKDRADRLILTLDGMPVATVSEMSADEYFGRTALLFMSLDTDRDAGLTTEEFMAEAPPVMDISEVLNREFDNADADGDGELTTTELINANAKKAEAAREMGRKSDHTASDSEAGAPIVYYRYPSTL